MMIFMNARKRHCLYLVVSNLAVFELSILCKFKSTCIHTNFFDMAQFSIRSLKRNLENWSDCDQTEWKNGMFALAVETTESLPFG